jgi:hypothetical protein
LIRSLSMLRRCFSSSMTSLLRRRLSGVLVPLLLGLPFASPAILPNSLPLPLPLPFAGFSFAAPFANPSSPSPLLGMVSVEVFAELLLLPGFNFVRVFLMNDILADVREEEDCD